MKRTEHLLKKGAFKHIKKYSLKKFIKDWSYNFTMLQSPEHLLFQEVLGTAGALVGMVLAFLTFLSLKKPYYWLIVIGFTCLIFYSQFKQKLQQYLSIKDVKKMYEGCKE
jgi:hypothetical protein